MDNINRYDDPEYKLSNENGDNANNNANLKMRNIRFFTHELLFLVV